MDFKNSKTFDLHRLLPDVTDKLNVQRCDK